MELSTPASYEPAIAGLPPLSESVATSALAWIYGADGLGFAVGVDLRPGRSQGIYATSLVRSSRWLDSEDAFAALGDLRETEFTPLSDVVGFRDVDLDDQADVQNAISVGIGIALNSERARAAQAAMDKMASLKTADVDLLAELLDGDSEEQPGSTKKGSKKADKDDAGKDAPKEGSGSKSGADVIVDGGIKVNVTTKLKKQKKKDKSGKETDEEEYVVDWPEKIDARYSVDAGGRVEVHVSEQIGEIIGIFTCQTEKSEKSIKVKGHCTIVIDYGPIHVEIKIDADVEIDIYKQIFKIAKNLLKKKEDKPTN